MDLEKYLKEIQEKAKEVVDGSYPLEEVFTDEFLTLNSKFENLNTFLDNSPFDFKAENVSFEKINDTNLDQYIAENSEFDNYNDFVLSASNEAGKKRLKEAGFDVK